VTPCPYHRVRLRTSTYLMHDRGLARVCPSKIYCSQEAGKECGFVLVEVKKDAS
jgi:hypothetical protein